MLVSATAVYQRERRLSQHPCNKVFKRPGLKSISNPQSRYCVFRTWPMEPKEAHKCRRGTRRTFTRFLSPRCMPCRAKCSGLGDKLWSQNSRLSRCRDAVVVRYADWHDLTGLVTRLTLTHCLGWWHTIELPLGLHAEKASVKKVLRSSAAHTLVLGGRDGAQAGLVPLLHRRVRASEGVTATIWEFQASKPWRASPSATWTN